MMLVRSQTLTMVALSLVLAAGCATDEADTGASIEIPLVQTGADGALYRLAGASFEVTAADMTVQTISGDVDAPSVEATLAPGPYTVRLLAGWQLQRSIDGTFFTPVTALLGSVNPQAVQIFPDTSSTVQFRFLVRDAQGVLSIALGVVSQPQQLNGRLTFTTATGVLASYAGRAVSYALYFDGAGQTTETAADGARQRHYTAVGIAADFFDDPIGIFATGVAAQTAGGSLDMAIRVEADGTQTLTGGTLTATGSPLSFGPATVQVALDAAGFPVDAAFATSAPFTLTGPASTAAGTITIAHTLD